MIYTKFLFFLCMIEFINLTSASITIIAGGITQTFPLTGMYVECSVDYSIIGLLSDIPIYGLVYSAFNYVGTITEFPEYTEGTIYIVTETVAKAMQGYGRSDIVYAANPVFDAGGVLTHYLGFSYA